jgi:protein-tyrosine phosphatase
MTHPTWELEIVEGYSALILTPCPGTKKADLSSSVKQLKTQGVQAVLSAIELAEMDKKGVSALPLQIQKQGMAWFHLPIEDDSIPDQAFAEKWQQVSPELHKIIKRGGKLALHCMGGSGRTGLLAAHILLELGWNLDRVKSEVKALRPNAFTKACQIEYIEQL